VGRAALDGRPAATVDDIRALAAPVLAHRLVRSFVAESKGVGADEIVGQVLSAVRA
jgi:MoxR-like ATPase